MKKWMAVAAMVVMMSGAALRSQTASAVSAAEQQSIETTLDGFGSRLTKMDFDAFSKLFTDDCDFVNIVGMHWHGKARVVKAYDAVQGRAAAHHREE